MDLTRGGPRGPRRGLLTSFSQADGAEAEGHHASDVHRFALPFQFHVPTSEAAANEVPEEGG